MMRARHILGQGLTWKNPLPGENEGSEEAVPMDGESAHAAAAPQTDIPSSSTQPPPSNSSLENKLDLLIAKVDAQSVINDYVLDQLRWNERMLTSIAQHLGLKSDMNPPPKFPGAPPQEPHPNPPSTKGKEKVVASPSDDDDLLALTHFRIVPHEDIGGEAMNDEGSTGAHLIDESDEDFDYSDIMLGGDDFEDEIRATPTTVEPVITPSDSPTKSTTISTTPSATSSP